jgi:LasA protease
MGHKLFASKNSFAYRLVMAVFLVWVLPSLACNFPFAANSSHLDVELRSTLTAMADSSLVEQTPVPEGEVNQNLSPEDEAQSFIPTAVNNHRPVPPVLDAGGHSFTYLTASGDTLQAVAKRFAVEPNEILSAEPIPEVGLLPQGQALNIPNQLGELQYTEFLLPDSEVVNSPSARDFQIEEFINTAGGYLSEHHEQVNGSWLSGAEIVTKVSLENSINPRLLLALLELRSGWVYGDLFDPGQLDYPVGFYVPDYKGLYYELVLTATHLGVGYYGWRSGEKTTLTFQDGSSLRLNPSLNPGTVGLQTVLSKISTQEEWSNTLYAEPGFVELYSAMFGDPWSQAAQIRDLFPVDLTQPDLLLPFAPGERWSFTGGPHRSWNAGSPRGALDFSPVTGEPACTTSRAWVTASASGVVTRAGDSVLAIDLDGDGHEQTGWVLVYLHMVMPEDILPGRTIAVDEPLGHPSCERGQSTGTHVHFARKYNGEWIPAGEPLPFTLSGWETIVGERNYQGELRKGEQTITANPGGPSSSLIIRDQ